MAKMKQGPIAGKNRGVQKEKLTNGNLRIWWNEWAATIRKKDLRVFYNHLHNLQYYACRGKEQPRCRCNVPVPEELLYMANLQKFKVGED